MKKTLVITFIIANTFSSFVNAKVLSSAAEEVYRTKITQGCIDTYKAPKGNKVEVCKCVGENFITVGRNWAKSSEREAVLDFIVKYFKDELTQKESDADPFMLDDFIYDISKDCMDNPKFKLKKD